MSRLMHLKVDTVCKIFTGISSRFRLGLILSIAVFTMTSCGSVLYAPMGQNVPFIKEKGDVVAGISYHVSLEAEFTELLTGLSGQFALGVGKSYEIIGTFHAALSPSVSISDLGVNEGHASIYYLEGGAGKYYNKLDSKLMADIIIGSGIGWVSNGYNGQNVNATFIKPFLQPSIGYRSKHFECAFTPRLAIVEYVRDRNSLEDSFEAKKYVDYFNKKRTTSVFEPGVTIRFVIKNYKAQFQYCHTSFSYSGDGLSPVYKNYTSLGFVMTIHSRKKKNRE